MRIRIVLLTLIIVCAKAAAASPTGSTDPADTLQNATSPEPGGQAVPLLPAISPQERGARLMQARDFVRSGNYPESMSLYRGLYKANRHDPDAICGMADVYYRAGRKAEALLVYKDAVRENPKSTRLAEAREDLEMEAYERIHSDGEYFEDTDGQRASRSRIWFDGGEARKDAILASVFREEMVISPGPSSNRIRGWGATLGGSALLFPGWTGSAEGGATKFGSVNPRTWIQATLAGRSLSGISVNGVYSFRDRGYELRSYHARTHGITGHEGLVSVSAVQGGAGLIARFRGGSLSDGNAYRGGEVAWDQLLYGNGPFSLFTSARAVVRATGIDYDDASEVYYAPSKEWSATAGFLTDIWRHGRFDIAGGFRAGRAGNDITHGTAINGEIKGGFRIDRYSFFQAGFVYDQGVRSDLYIGREYRAGFQWGH